MYNVGEHQQDKVYYYPLSDEQEKIVLVVEAIIIDGKVICNLSDDLVELLNVVQYKNEDTLIYHYEGNVYAETPEKTINAYYVYVEPDENKACLEMPDWDIPYEEKKSIVNEAEKNMIEFSKPKFESEEELLVTKMYGKLTLSHPKGQYGYAMCWASTVATIHNYYISSVVTGFEICTRMGIGYNAGGNIYDEQDALALYNITYDRIRSSALTWDELKENIDEEKPFIINGVAASSSNLSSYVGHAVTGYGYSGENYSSRTVAIWNSNFNNGTGGYATFSYGEGCFTDSGRVFYWASTLSYY